MDSVQKELVEKIKGANNVLVTVSRNPSVDQLASCIGLTLIINKLGKHGTAVFSGEIPSTIEFLQPEETLEKNTDSLRDFIIALDKSKADKLRYKVEDDVVRIFITPYKTSISEADLEFSQGDFNVDLVVALGVHQQEDFDEAIGAHGRILHDATLSSINLSGEGLGNLNWNDPNASSLSELVTELAQVLGDNLLDAQVATALLTGIVAETGRFGNEKTTPQTMNLSAVLMSAGANQQLVASKLEEPIANTDAMSEPAPLDPVDEQQENHEENSKDDNHDESNESSNSQDSENDKTEEVSDEPEKPHTNDGEIEIQHDDQKQSEEDQAEVVIGDQPIFVDPVPDEPAEAPKVPEQTLPEPIIEPELPKISDAAAIPTESTPEPATPVDASTNLMNHSPSHQPVFTAGSLPEDEGSNSSADVLGVSPTSTTPLLSHNQPEPTPEDPQAQTMIPPPPSWMPTEAKPEPASAEEPVPAGTPEEHEDTLADLEAAVHEAHIDETDVTDARDEVSRALSTQDSGPEAIQALNAQPLGEDLHPSLAPPAPLVTPTAEISIEPSVEAKDPNAPPPVPPPMPFQFGPSPPQQ